MSSQVGSSTHRWATLIVDPDSKVCLFADADGCLRFASRDAAKRWLTDTIPPEEMVPVKLEQLWQEIDDRPLIGTR